MYCLHYSIFHTVDKSIVKTSCVLCVYFLPLILKHISDPMIGKYNFYHESIYLQDYYNLIVVGFN